MRCSRHASALSISLAAGSLLTLTGCMSSFDDRADVVNPETGAPFDSSNNAGFNDQAFVDAAFTRAPDAPQYYEDPNRNVTQNTFGPQPVQQSTRPAASDGWLMVAAATEAELAGQSQPRVGRPQAQTPQPPMTAASGSTPFGSAPTGPGIAARLYNDILNTQIPTSGQPIGTHTTNIQQMSFAADGSDFDPSVSRDGLHIVYASTQHRPEADIYSQRIGSKVITRLTDDPAADVMPALSSNGERIAYASNRAGNWDIWIMPSTGGRSLQITQDPSPELHPSFSPDGQHVVYCRLGTSSGRWEIWVSDTFGESGAQFIGYGLFPEWCPIPGTGANGADRIVFQRSRERGSRTFSIWTIDFDRARGSAGRETQIASDPSFALINPTWSPDGVRIAYASVPNPERWTGIGRGALPPSASIEMIGVDGRGQVALTGGNSIDMMPAWSPSGRMFFVSDRSGVENLWSVDIAPAILAATGEDPWNDVASFENNARGEQRGVTPFGPGMNSFVSAPTEP